jgi:hypothetical protein
MGGRFRLAFWVTAALTAAGAAFTTALTVDSSHTFSHLVGWATLATIPAGAVAAGAAVWTLRLRSSPSAEPTADQFESDFALKLQLDVDRALSFALGPAGGERAVNLRFDKLTSYFRDYGGGATGDLDSIAEYFTSLPSGRMVVLGGPGSGKTILALELQAQLLKSRGDGQADQIPVLVNAGTYHPGVTWASWLAGHLARTYLLPEEPVEQLVLNGRILTIIDGLDELGRAGAEALIGQLNIFIRERVARRGDHRPRMVITCREADYQELAWPLDSATHVEVQTLEPEEVSGYLLENGIEVPDALASVLTSPLMLSLAATIYSPSTGSGEPIDDLLRMPDEIAVERHLLAAFLANAYRRNIAGSSWSFLQAERWLALIGSQMRAHATEGFSWRQIAYALPSRLLGLLGGAVTGLALLVTFTILGITHHVFGDRMAVGPAIGALAAVSFAPAIVASSLVGGFNSGAATGDLLPALSGRRMQLWLLSRRQGTRSRATSPHSDLIQSRRRTVIAGAAVGVVLAIVAVALDLVGARVPRDATIVFVCYCVAVFVLCCPWGSFQLARAWFSLRRALPYRLLNFLDDAHMRGVFRSSGWRFEFRNDAVRAYFSDPARLPEVRREISGLAAWALGNPEISESYRYVGADQSDIEQAVSSLATETILAGRPFAVDAATRQAVLERVRVRLNELGRRSAFAESLLAREAPGLGTVVDPSRVILTRTMDDLARLIDRISSASVGISGTRGIGKSTLIRWLCAERNATGRLPSLGMYVTAPVEYDARDFLVHLYITLCKAVLSDDRLTDHRARQHRSLWRAVLAIILAAAGSALYYHQVVDHQVTARWKNDQGYLWSVAASLLFAGALFVLISVINGMRRRRGGKRRTSLEATARDRLSSLRYQVVETTGQTGGLTGPWGLSFSGSRSRQITENQMTLPELVDSYREFAGLTVSALQETARRDGAGAVAQVRLVVGIDEIDRIEDAGNAEKFLNDIKSIFGIPNCFYIASLSADALANFERRVVSTRTAFDTTFDTVIRIGPLELGTARQVLELRAIGLPYPFITLCYVLSGGVPRELMRIARSIFDVRNEVPFGATEEGDAAAAFSVIAPRVIAREMDSLRQGLMPLATQLNVPGATELIGLLDDPGWPSGNMQQDLDKLAGVTRQRALFQDETGNISAAAKICDGLAAASYFFLSVDELFKTKLDQIIADLKRYDATRDRDPEPASSIHLLARARAAIGVNPALAIARVQAAKGAYGIVDDPPALLSQLLPDPVKNPRPKPPAPKRMPGSSSTANLVKGVAIPDTPLAR